MLKVIRNLIDKIIKPVRAEVASTTYDIPNPLTSEFIANYLRSAKYNNFTVSYGWTVQSIDGWTFYCYDDCGEIDYIERIEAPDGQVLELII
jgi:hypothetical protein